MDAIVRKFQTDDAEELNNMIKYTIEESYKWVYPEQVRELFKKESVPERLIERSERNYLLIAIDPDDADKIIGTGTLADNRVFSVYVHPEYQGNGIGIRLMEQLEDRAIGNGLKKITLSASISSRDFYKKIGYSGDPKISKLNDGTEYIVYDMEKDIQ